MKLDWKILLMEKISGYMQNFLNFLIDKYGKPASVLSKSAEGNILVENQTIMISLDDMSKDLKNFNRDFKQQFATADALHVIIKNDKIKLYFIEFKNKDFSKIKERLQEKESLKDLILTIEDDNIKKDFLKHQNKLIDKSMMRLRMKPYDSLSLIYYFMKHYFIEKNSDECVNNLFAIEKYFVLISKTPTDYNPLFQNRSNRNNEIIKPLRFLKRLVPYYYDDVLTLPHYKFDSFIYKLDKS